jgi:hypothetical protein
MPCVLQLPLLKERWKTILLGAIFQYVHAMATQLAHRMHRPLAQPLHDVGFDLLPVSCSFPDSLYQGYRFHVLFWVYLSLLFICCHAAWKHISI